MIKATNQIKSFYLYSQLGQLLIFLRLSKTCSQNPPVSLKLKQNNLEHILFMMFSCLKLLKHQMPVVAVLVVAVGALVQHLQQHNLHHHPLLNVAVLRSHHLHSHWHLHHPLMGLRTAHRSHHLKQEVDWRQVKLI